MEIFLICYAILILCLIYLLIGSTNTMENMIVTLIAIVVAVVGVIITSMKERKDIDNLKEYVKDDIKEYLKSDIKTILFKANAYDKINEFLENGIEVDHIITDPPYNISQKNNFGTMKNPRKGIDFGEWDQGNFDLYSWIPKYSKILKKDGSMIIFCSYRYISYIIDVLEKESTGMMVKDILIWQKSNPMPRNINRRYVQDMEFAIWAVKKNAKWFFNKPKKEPYLRGIFTSPVVSGKEKLGHPTQKSIRLMDSIIKIHTNPNDVILDPFMGSGTTGEASLCNNRKFIGIENDDEYYLMAEKRLQNFSKN